MSDILDAMASHLAETLREFAAIAADECSPSKRDFVVAAVGRAAAELDHVRGLLADVNSAAPPDTEAGRAIRDAETRGDDGAVDDLLRERDRSARERIREDKKHDPFADYRPPEIAGEGLRRDDKSQGRMR